MNEISLTLRKTAQILIFKMLDEKKILVTYSHGENKEISLLSLSRLQVI